MREGKFGPAIGFKGHEALERGMWGILWYVCGEVPKDVAITALRAALEYLEQEG